MNKNGVIRRLLAVMTGKYKAELLLVLLFILVSTFANVAGSFFIQRLIDTDIPLALQTGSFSGLLRVIAVMAAVYLAGVVCTFLYNRMMVSVSQGVQKTIRDNLFQHMQRLPIRYFDIHTHGDIMSRFTNDNDTLREFFSMSLPQLISSLATILTVTVVMLLLSPVLTLIVFVFMLATLAASRRLSVTAAKLFRQQQAAVGDLNGYIREMIQGQKVIKVFCHEQETLAGFDEKNAALQTFGEKANQRTNMLMPIVMNIGGAQYVATAALGGLLALHGLGGVTLGLIAAFLTLSRTFSAPIGQISAQVNAVTMALAGAGRIFGLMDEPPEADEGYVTLVNARLVDGHLTETAERTGLWAWKHPHSDGSVTYTELRGDVCFDDVDFGYSEEKLALRNVSLYARPGQKIAFVGATGAGKTTITNLINRFYDIADGKIRYDGININKIKKADLRRSLGIVLQDTHLFTGTIADNIRYGRLGATDEEVRAAAKTANADGFIRRLPEGYDTMLSSDGGSLSGGQRQLIAIARAAVANPPVMILDEATSSIDTRTEAIVQRGMDALMEGRTVFVIAHRLSTVKNADVILVLEQGRIIERGSHSDLIAAHGKYWQLYTGKLG
ncbi:MAG: ABC transporter ATP-binding protein/permease [Oscillospiraceae bacterium]|jgi:ATP-binding cassette subfamily B protein|nr:ABC transporter ATP-binding protein/permease [Oscillospiraceae bacterium]